MVAVILSLAIAIAFIVVFAWLLFFWALNNKNFYDLNEK